MTGFIVGLIGLVVLAFIFLVFIGLVKILVDAVNNGPKKRQSLRNGYVNIPKIKMEVKTNRDDNFEGWFYEEVEEYFPSNSQFRIKYRDGKGQETERVIDIYKFGEAQHGWFFLAYCQLREGNRTFRSDRVLECVDMKTGEYVNDPSALLLERWHNSNEYKALLERIRKREEREAETAFIENYLNEHSALLKTLLYLVRCDGRFDMHEKAIVKEVLEYINNDDLPSDKTLEKIYKKIALPTYGSFQASVRKLIQEAKYSIDIIDIAQRIVNTQSTVHPNEEQALNYLLNKSSK